MNEEQLAGRTLGDRYDLLERVGSGGMGAVYRARDRELDEIVALKVIRAELARDPAMIERFRHEVKLARKVTHVNVARTFELGRADNLLFCTMELVTGESLSQRLKRDQRLPPTEAVAIASALCDGLAAAHAAGVIHRDIKPDNVLIADDGRVVLADFGVAALAAAGGELSGTPSFMAPEQARGDAPSPACDVYSVGVLLYEMVTGRRAFAGDAAQVLADKQVIERLEPFGEAPDELARVIAHATEREPAARIASAVELRHALAPWSRMPRLRTEPSVAERHGTGEATVVLLAPHGEIERMYLGEAVFEETLALLARTPRLRVLARWQDAEPATVVACLEIHEQLNVRIERAGTSTVLELPLAFDHVVIAARTIANAITTAVGLPAPVAPDVASEAFDLMLQARFNIKSSLERSRLAVEQIERANQLLPGDPQIAAVMALVLVRHAFFMADAPPDTLERAAKAAHRAVVTAPGLADAQLASGHVHLHHGNPVVAARHYRFTIARAPHNAEAHEYLGRMLLESGYIDRALPRLETAIAIMPSRRAVRWEIARLHALEQRWDECDRLLDDLSTPDIDRPIVRVRFAAWRRDRECVRQIAAEFPTFGRFFMPGIMQAMSAVFVDGKWADYKAQLVQFARGPATNYRRTTFVAQIGAELAGYSGDHDTAAELIDYAIPYGLFDLHWLDHCPLLDGVRALPRFGALREPLAKRAEAILDALYGEQDIGTSDTAFASGPTLATSR